MLAIASVYQSWDDQRRVTMDGVRTMPMDEMAQLKEDNRKMRQDADIGGALLLNLGAEYEYMVSENV